MHKKEFKQKKRIKQSELKEIVNTLFKLGQSLKERELSLKQKEGELLAQEIKLKEIELSLKQKEEGLSAQEIKLKEIELSLRQKEEELLEQEKKLKALEENSYAFQYWESCEEVEKNYHIMNNKMKELSLAIRQFGVKSQNNFLHTPLEKLALLYREVGNIDEFKNTAIPDTINEILLCLGAKKIEPHCNDIYDSKIHEKVEMICGGRKIDYCIACGWNFKEEILIRALVKTYE